MIKLDIDVDLHGTDEKLRAMSARGRDFRLVLEKARVLLGKANAENFTSGGLPSGGWSPRRSPAPWPLMIRSGRLMGSLTNLRGAPNHIGLTSATFGTAVEYAKFHQTGTRKMASRKIVFEPRGFAEEVGGLAAEHIVGGMGRYFS